MHGAEVDYPKQTLQISITEPELCYPAQYIVLDYNIDNYTFCRSLVPHIRCSLHATGLKLHSTFYDDEYENFQWYFIMLVIGMNGRSY